jgi:hypothetical protein
MGADNLHVKYAASKAELRALCPGSVRASACVPSLPSGPAALKGTKAHKVLETAVDNGYSAYLAWVLLHKNSPIDIDGELSTYEKKPDDDIVEAVQFAIDYINEKITTGVVCSEIKTKFPSSAAPDQVWGTTDVRGYEPTTKTLHVMDYKNGVGYVDAFENRQALQYAVSVYTSEWALDFDIECVEITIIQPNSLNEADKVRSWRITPAELFSWMLRLEEEIEACEAPDAPLVAGDHCRKYYCQARVTCQALEHRALAIAGDQFKQAQHIQTINLPEVKTLDPFRLSMILKGRKLVEDWFEEVAKHAHELSRLGTIVPGFKVVEAQARRAWHGDELNLALQLQALTGLSEEDIRPRSLITITAAEKLVRKAAKNKGAEPKDLVDKMAFLTLKQSSGNTSLVPEEDKRPSINIANMTFQQVQLGDK